MAQTKDAVEDGGSASSKKARLMMVAVVLVALLAGGGGVAAIFMFAGGGEAQVGDAPAAPAVKAKAIYTKIRTLEGQPMFIVTLGSEDGKRHFLQTHVEAKSREQEVADALTLHMPRVVGLLNALFSTQRFEPLQTQDGKLQLRSEALLVVQNFMQEKVGRPGVEALLFTSFVMQ
jgi:flagellar FliL protein